MRKYILIVICVLNLGLTRHLPLGVHSYCTDPRLIALTFDDGVSKNYPELLSILDKKQVHATFFILGETLRNPTKRILLQSAYNKGHQIANHTFNHLNLVNLKDSKIESEVQDTQNALQQMATKCLRPPYGNVDQRVYDKLNSLGYAVVLWNLDADDWNPKVSKEKMWSIYEHVLNTANAAKISFIVLMHDKRQDSLDLLPRFIDLARARGFRFVTLAECLRPKCPLT